VLISNQRLVREDIIYLSCISVFEILSCVYGYCFLDGTTVVSKVVSYVLRMVNSNILVLDFIFCDCRKLLLRLLRS